MSNYGQCNCRDQGSHNYLPIGGQGNCAPVQRYAPACNLSHSGKYTYRRHPNLMPQSGWHGRNLHQSLCNYGTHGSYAGRSRPSPSPSASPYRCAKSYTR